jgi:single-stranded DNA-binding protein
MNGQRTHQFNLYGNLGGDPESHTLKARTVTRQGYDINLDDIVDQEHTIPERQIHTVSLAINGKGEDGEEIVRWHRLVDFADYLSNCRKGDRVKVKGYFRERTYLKEDEEKSIREIVLTAAAEIQPKREQAQAA